MAATNALFPLKIPALQVRQPLGIFYAAVIPADVLLSITYSLPLAIKKPTTGTPAYPFDGGTQRPESVPRHKEIGRFIDTTEAAFPNAIILAANYDQSGMQLTEDDETRWHVNRSSELVVPSGNKLATIVDGQHRLHGFKYSEVQGRRSMPLLCSVYLDLPNAFQAYLFATINFNQKKVPRSLAYELFGFNVEDEPPESWAPDKTAVLLCRKLNIEKESPLRGRIIVAAQNESVLFAKRPVDPDWRVSTATVVDGILSLISSNAMRDRDELHKCAVGEGRERSLVADVRDSSPLRSLYLEGNDLAIFTAVKNYFAVVSDLLWEKAPDDSYITRTVGIQALFDVLKTILHDFGEKRKISVAYFTEELRPVARIPFADDFFQASGKGRGRLRNAMLIAMGRTQLEDVSATDREGYAKVTGKRK